ncbi:MAG: hypothetical protein JJT78_14660 [Leptospira sp.]|nr:hypothetical protein [Leptospira sp.]
MKQYPSKSKAGFLFIFGFLVYSSVNCIKPLSPFEECKARNRCEMIEGECYLRNSVIYRTLAGTEQASTEDALILLGTCSGLSNTCVRNCRSGTLF